MDLAPVAFLDYTGSPPLLFEQHPSPMWVYDLETLAFLAVNVAATVVYGWSQAEFRAMTIRDIHPEPDIPTLLESFDYPHSGEWQHLTKDRRLLAVQITSLRVNFGGRSGQLEVAQDITAHRQAQETLERLLQATVQKVQAQAVLLRETHHRIQNNLQVVSSLLSLQAHQVRSQGTVGDVLRESRQRIMSIALIHQLLMQRPTQNYPDEGIDFAVYSRNLASHLFNIYGVSRERVILHINCNVEPLAFAHAYTCGLILNELLSNALKHAFPDDQMGEIYINLSKNTDDFFVLSIKDNGTDFPKGFEFTTAQTIGLQLVKDLVGQLRGKIQLTQEMGATFEISFPRSSTPG